MWNRFRPFLLFRWQSCGCTLLHGVLTWICNLQVITCASFSLWQVYVQAVMSKQSMRPTAVWKILLLMFNVRINWWFFMQKKTDGFRGTDTTGRVLALDPHIRFEFSFQILGWFLFFSRFVTGLLCTPYFSKDYHHRVYRLVPVNGRHHHHVYRLVRINRWFRDFCSIDGVTDEGEQNACPS